MSWEESAPEYRPCPCGNGTYSVVRLSDDWNRHKERWAMQCATCSRDYGLHEMFFYRRALSEKTHGWVPRPLLIELKLLQENAETKKEYVTAYLKAQYRAAWHQHFSGVSKKKIWTELTRNGQDYPQLSTFYAHIRQSNLDRVLDGYLSLHHSAQVIRILRLNDPDLDERLKEVDAVTEAVRTKEGSLCGQMFT